MLTRFSKTQQGMIFALAGYSAFAISDVSAKLLTETLPILLIAAYIPVFACLFLALLSPWIGGLSGPKRGLVKLHLFRGVMNFCISITFILAISKLSLATTYTMIFAKPFIVALLAIPLYKQHPSLKHWAIIAIGFTGVLIAMRPSPGSFDLTLILPLISATCAALMWVVSRSMEDETPFAIGFYPLLLTSLLCLPFIGADFQLPTLPEIPLLAICGAGVATGMITLSIAFRSAEGAKVAPFQYTQMVWGLIFGYLIFADIPALHTILGAVIIIASGLYLLETERRLPR